MLTYTHERIIHLKIYRYYREKITKEDYTEKILLIKIQISANISKYSLFYPQCKRNEMGPKKCHSTPIKYNFYLIHFDQLLSIRISH